MYGLSTRTLWRLRESWALLAAIALAVSCVASLTWLQSRLERALVAEAGSWLGGDLQVASPRPLVEARQRWRAQRTDLAFAESVVTTTVLRFGEETQLVSLRAISESYPLRGRIELAPGGEALDEAGIWVDARLAHTWGLQPGDTVAVGRLTLTVRGVVLAAPERGADFLSFLPEAMVRLPALHASGLLAPGSRASYRLHIAVSDPGKVPEVRAQLAAHLAPGERLVALEESQPAFATLMQETGRFLRLAALAAVALAVVAATLAARAAALRLTPQVAVLRCLGASRRQLWRLYGGGIALLGVLAIALGLTIGALAQEGLSRVMAQAIGVAQLPAPDVGKAASAVALGVLIVAGFVLPWLSAVVRVPPTRVLRRDQVLPWRGQGMWLPLAGLAVLLVATAGQWRWGLAVLGVLLLLLAGFAVLAAALLLLSHRLVAAASGATPLRLTLLVLARQPFSTGMQVAALAIGLAALWLLVFIRSDLIEAWRFKVPPEAPDRFVLNVLPEQTDALAALFAEHGVPPPRFWPIVRARLVAINGAPIPPELLTHPRAERLAQREFNNTYSTMLPEGNRIVAGRWHGETNETGVVSVEAGLAQLFRLQVGDTVTFSVEGEEVTARLGSIRALRWESMQPNFFFIASPDVLVRFPTTLMAAYRAPSGAAGAALERALYAGFPNLTVIDVGRIRSEFERVSDRVVALVQALFGYALVAGALVVAVAWAMSDEARGQRVALLRALGMPQVTLQAHLVSEALMIGLLASMLSLAAAIAVGKLVAQQFGLPGEFNLMAPTVAAIATALAVAVWGSVRGRRLLASPPMAVLKEG